MQSPRNMEMERVVPGQDGGLMIVWETKKVRKQTSMYVRKFRACGYQRKGLVEFTDTSNIPSFGTVDVPFHLRPSQPPLQPRLSQRGSWMGTRVLRQKLQCSWMPERSFRGWRGISSRHEAAVEESARLHNWCRCRTEKSELLMEA